MSAKICLAFFLCALVGVAVEGQMVRQCQCSEIQPCKANYLGSIIPCMDACQNHAAALGANYPKLKQCLLTMEPNLKQTVACTEGQHSDSCAKGGAGQQVPKRYPETLRIAALSEINRMLGRSGIANEVKGLLAQGKKIFGCMQTCMNKKAGNCEKKLGCGLMLPSDTVLVQSAKQCAIQSGVNTQSVQEMCRCVANSGVSQLNGICNRITIS